MQERGRHAHRRHDGGGKQDVAQVGHGGVGQPPLEVALLQRHGGAEHHRDHGQRHNGVLAPGARQDIGAEGEVNQTDAGEGARLDHRHRVQQRRYRRGGHGGADEPAVHGPDGGLDAAAHKGQHEHAQQQIHIAGIACQMATGNKLLGVVDDQEHHADKGQRRARNGVGGVFHARVDGLFCHGVHHQRDGGQRQQLIEQVHGHHVGGEGDAQRHAEGCREEGPEHGLVALVLHVVPCVHHGKGP